MTTRLPPQRAERPWPYGRQFGFASSSAPPEPNPANDSQEKPGFFLELRQPSTAGSVPSGKEAEQLPNAKTNARSPPGIKKTDFLSDFMPRAAPQTMKMGRPAAGAKRLECGSLLPLSATTGPKAPASRRTPNAARGRTRPALGPGNRQSAIGNHLQVSYHEHQLRLGGRSEEENSLAANYHTCVFGGL